MTPKEIVENWPNLTISRGRNQTVKLIEVWPEIKLLDESVDFVAVFNPISQDMQLLKIEGNNVLTSVKVEGRLTDLFNCIASLV